MRFREYRMDTNDETLATWDKVANLYAEKFMEMSIYDKTYDAFCQLLVANAKILEVGCGPGNIAKYILGKHSDYSWLGIDTSPQMIQLAKKQNPKGVFKVMDVRGIKQLSQKYDGIISGFCLPYLLVKEVAIFIQNSKELLKEKGYLYISFAAGEPSLSHFQTGSTGDRVYFNYHSFQTLRKEWIDNDFELVYQDLIDYDRGNGETEEHSILILKRGSSDY